MCLYNSSSLGVPECKEFPDTYISHQSFSLPKRSSPGIFSLQGLPTSSPGGSLSQVHQSALTNPKPTWPPSENKLLKAQVCALNKGRGSPGWQVLSLDISDHAPVKTGMVFTRLLQYFWNCKCPDQAQFEVLALVNISKKRKTPITPWHAPSSRHLHELLPWSKPPLPPQQLHQVTFHCPFRTWLISYFFQEEALPPPPMSELGHPLLCAPIVLSPKLQWSDYLFIPVSRLQDLWRPE